MQRRSRTTPKARRFFVQLESIVDEHYSEPSFDVKGMAACLDISERQFQRKLKAVAACSPSHFLRTYRLGKSLGGLESGLTIGEVAKAVGFRSQSYFTVCFKAHYGITPSKYQTDMFTGY